MNICIWNQDLSVQLCANWGLRTYTDSVALDQVQSESFTVHYSVYMVFINLSADRVLDQTAQITTALTKNSCNGEDHHLQQGVLFVCTHLQEPLGPETSRRLLHGVTINRRNQTIIKVNATTKFDKSGSQRCNY